ncbi:hypothetical protein KL86CLO1_12380 [uncultured Eubacteriales bacterium]|uniref:Uncharacterized protein n=1 Tax=uncultured Eubacteriales bacterium TaxID=172733 RepID=A0A212K8E4_9FIRM|nr:hypothetical protein KL86CLO1_12380 [uncultured Eubacteriales bacterium]
MLQRNQKTLFCTPRPRLYLRCGRNQFCSIHICPPLPKLMLRNSISVKFLLDKRELLSYTSIMIYTTPQGGINLEGGPPHDGRREENGPPLEDGARPVGWHFEDGGRGSVLYRHLSADHGDPGHPEPGKQGNPYRPP